VDLSKLTASDWLMVGGGGLMFVSGFLGWVKLTGPAGTRTANAFDFTLTGAVPWLLLCSIGVVALLLATGTMPRGTTPWPLLFVYASATATLLLLVRLIFNPIDGKETFESLGGEIGFGLGIFGALIAAVLTAVGAVRSFTDGGGDLRELTDVEKIKRRFAGSGARRDDPPPPPPPGAD
jgi:hypothetical protein